ncbi:hypothetical protein OROGR_008445 [Orobanche gracilis]
MGGMTVVDTAMEFLVTSWWEVQVTFVGAAFMVMAYWFFAGGDGCGRDNWAVLDCSDGGAHMLDDKDKSFPRFDGREAWGWLIDVEQYCEASGISEEKRFLEAERSVRRDAYYWWKIELPPPENFENSETEQPTAESVQREEEAVTTAKSEFASAEYVGAKVSILTASGLLVSQAERGENDGLPEIIEQKHLYSTPCSSEFASRHFRKSAN